MSSQSYTVPAAARIGHVHLKVSDLDRSVAFYRDALGLALNADLRALGVPAAFLAAGDYHHHIALNTFEGAGATPPPPGHTGLFHVAIVYPDHEALARAVEQVLACGATVDGGRDHGGTVSVYLRDPDRHGLELYYDRPRTEWFDANGRFIVKNEPFEVASLLAVDQR
jgi:catechol 2,3-dioxygenase